MSNPKRTLSPCCSKWHNTGWTVWDKTRIWWRCWRNVTSSVIIASPPVVVTSAPVVEGSPPVVKTSPSVVIGWTTASWRWLSTCCEYVVFMLFYVVLPCFANACCSPIKKTATAATARTHDSNMLQLGASPFVLGRESSWWREVALNIIRQPPLQWLQWQRTTKKHKQQQQQYN